MPPRSLGVEDIVAIRHVHTGYKIPYFLACVQEEPVSTKPNERLRVVWLESPEPADDGGFVYPIQSIRGEVRGDGVRVVELVAVDRQNEAEEAGWHANLLRNPPLHIHPA